MPITPSPLQEAIFQHVAESDNNLVVSACAGGAKSTTQREALSHIDQEYNTVMVAFNKDIADATRAKVSDVEVRTYHSLGFSSIMKSKAYTGVTVEDDKAVQMLVHGPLGAITARRFIGIAASHLWNMARVNLITDLSNRTLLDLAITYDIELYDDSPNLKYEIFDHVRWLQKEWLNNTKQIDFTDQIWLPTNDDRISIRKFDILLGDECLPYKTPVHLADGSWMFIGDIVDQKLSVDVLSYDVRYGEQRPCKITGWSKTPNQKPMVKIKVKWSKRVGENCPTSFVTCTSDHKVWTKEYGYVPAGNIPVGSTVQVETSAYKSEHYKLSAKGKSSLVEETNKRNSRGFDRKNGANRESFLAIKGGNGTGLTEAQGLLLDGLGNGWVPEYPIKTAPVGGQAAGFPTTYKADIANPDRMIVVEVDGASHRKRKDQDKKKDGCLVSLGWKVYRVTNDDVFHNYDNVVNAILVDCPIDATVVSVDETYTNERYVYDITVEDCHNFYANGILVHNCQDTNPAQLELLLQSFTHKAMFVGDPNQAIYMWAGAGSDSMDVILSRTNADELPLSICYRCTKATEKLVNDTFPHIPFTVPEWAKDGQVLHLPASSLVDQLTDGDMVICRVNADLVQLAFECIKNGKKAMVRGRKIGDGLSKLIKKQKAYDMADLTRRLEAWRNRQIEKMMALDHIAKVREVQDQFDTIIILSENCDTVDQLVQTIDKLFSDTNSGIVCTSAHRSKGLEAGRTILIRPDLMPHPMAKSEEAKRQERNLLYVSYTRSRGDFIIAE